MKNVFERLVVLVITVLAIQLNAANAEETPIKLTAAHSTLVIDQTLLNRHW